MTPIEILSIKNIVNFRVSIQKLSISQKGHLRTDLVEAISAGNCLHVLNKYLGDSPVNSLYAMYLQRYEKNYNIDELLNMLF